ncbi:MAG: hypothetical protein R3B47_05905 [Bacteroidia bacterium]
MRKGVRIGKEDIRLEQTFKDVSIHEAQRNQYRQFFGFEQELPLPLLYPLAQRAIWPSCLTSVLPLPSRAWCIWKTGFFAR